MGMKEAVYLGTYMRRLSKGYKADFDTETGQLANLRLFAAEPSPTYLAFDQQQHLHCRNPGWLKGGIFSTSRWRFANHVVEALPIVMWQWMKNVVVYGTSS